jgi:hypothetical protein
MSAIALSRIALKLGPPGRPSTQTLPDLTSVPFSAGTPSIVT